MPFIELSGKNIRNLSQYCLQPSPTINIITGKNGAGKTNLLEAIYLNALGRSFRTSATRSIINDNEKSAWVFAQHQIKDGKTNKLGLERRKGNQQTLSINGVHHQSQAELAALIPTLAIQPSETQLIDGPSQQRRKHLDWVLFHVEPLFLDCWRSNQKLLKQRNLLLRRLSKKRNLVKNDLLELKAWDQGYIESTLQLSHQRQSIAAELIQGAQSYAKEFPAFNKGGGVCIEIEMLFNKGWVGEAERLGDVLTENIEQDLKKGFSGTGSHRCDLVIKADGHSAKEHLSRGQKKLLAMSMCLAQIEALSRLSNKKTIILLDDVFAELDGENVQAFISLLNNIDTQIFLSCAQTHQDIRGMFSKEARVFHVEQGKISAVI